MSQVISNEQLPSHMTPREIVGRLKQFYAGKNKKIKELLKADSESGLVRNISYYQECLQDLNSGSHKIFISWLEPNTHGDGLKLEKKAERYELFYGVWQKS